MPEFHYISEGVFTVSQFYSAEECQAAIDLAESLGFDEAPITTARGPVMRKDIRNNSRVMLDSPETAADLWQRVRDYIPRWIEVERPTSLEKWEAIGVNERLRFYRYDVGQQFDWHYDGWFARSESERSHITFMIYLNEGFEGGETAFEDSEILPREGLALLFVHRLLHKGEPVKQGRKYVLRTDVMYQRQD